MVDRPILDLLEDTYRVVRLHGWCAQTYELLDAVAAAAGRAEPAETAPLDTQLRSRLETAVSADERILSLAVLRELNIGPTDTADLVYRHLNGKLTVQGFAFCQRYFFGGASPIPDQITYEITQRVFISFQRAVFQAMRISEFTSDREPEYIVLYLTLLLCRDSLNEQNRAMVYLLLSRIDATLPPTVQTAVTEGMKNMRDVIREVEERQESVLSDTLRQEPERSSQAWDLQRTSGEPAPAGYQPTAAPAPLDRAAQAGSPTLGRSYEEGSRGQPGEAPQTTPEAATRVLPTAEGIRTERADWSTAASRPAPAAAATPGIPAREPDPPTPPAAPESARVASPAMAQRPAGGAGARRDSPARKGKAAPATDRPAETRSADWAPAAGGRLFAIRFSRQTSELAALLDTIREKVNTPPPKKGSGAAGEGRAAAGLFAGKRRWIWIGLGGAFLVAVVIFVVLATRGPAPAAEVRPTTTVVADAAPVAPAVTDLGNQPAAAAAEDPATAPGRTAAGLSLVSRDGETVWYPKSGESLWRLYIYLRRGGDDRNEITALAARGWVDFMDRIVEMNPGLARPDVIKPEAAIVLIQQGAH